MTTPRIPRQVADVFAPRVWRAGDGTTLVELDPRATVISALPGMLFQIVYRGPVFGRLVGHETKALSYVDIHSMTTEGVVRFRELV